MANIPLSYPNAAPRPSYSAARVISPAVERTKLFLFKPFRLGRWLKLTLVALLTEGGMTSCNFNSGLPSGRSGQAPPMQLPKIHVPHMPDMHGLPWVLGLLAVFLLVVIPVWLLIAYLLVRLRFSFFDCVLFEQDQIAPVWRRYHAQAVRYLKLTICVGVAFWLLLIPIGYGLYQQFKPLIASIWSDTPPSVWDFVPLFASAGITLLLMTLVFYLVDAMLGSFVLPRLALEDAEIGEALEAVWKDLRAEPGAFALFLLLRAVLGFGASIIAGLALFVPLIVVAIVGALLALVLKAMSTAAMIAVLVPAGVLVGAAFLAASVGLSGTIGTFRRNFAILFYAGRYPVLASVLWPPMPAPGAPVWQPGFPPPSVPPSSVENA